MSDKLKSVLIGIFIFAAVFSTIYVILFLEPQIGDGAKTLKVKFSNISGINVGTRVTLAGKPIGEVEKIKTVKDAREEKIDKLGRIYYYELTLKVDSSVKVYNSDEITIATTGLLGEKSIAIIPKAPKKGEILKRIDKQVIYAQPLEPLEAMMHHITTLTDKMTLTIDDFDKWFIKNQEDLSNFVENLATTSAYLSTDGTEILENVNKITKDIAEGKGSLGRFITQDDFYLRLSCILNKVDTLMNDINHYGILFQYDKHWQRIRKKRACLKEKLSTPKEFQNYCDKEMDNITTSLERLSDVIEKSQEDASSTKDFQKCFLMLLKQVEHLLDSIKLYNEKLSETSTENGNISKK